MSTRPQGKLDLADARDCIDLAGSYGLTPDDWQEWVIEGWLARSPRTRKHAAARCGLAVPRQNGKNAILEAVELFKMVIQGRRILHTAHEVKTARKAFLRLCSFFENERKYPELAALVKDVRKTNGQEAILLLNGGSVEFIARSKGSGRGFTVDDLVCDEAQELSDDALAALLPTISAAPSGDPQLILTGTPPAPSMTGDVFTRMRTAGMVGKDARLCWDEWSCTAGVNLDDRKMWAASNPALGIRLGVDVIMDERAAMDDETFARERGGLWDEGGVNAVVSPAVWAECLDIDSQITSRPEFGLDVSPNRSKSAIAVGGKRADGIAQIEVAQNRGLVDHRDGVEWVVPRLVALKAKWPNMRLWIMSGSAAESLVPGIKAAGIEVEVIKSGDATAACGLFYDLAVSRALRHVGQPELTKALEGAVKQDVGDGAWKWARRKSSTDITPLYAATGALWAASQAVKVPNVW